MPRMTRAQAAKIEQYRAAHFTVGNVILSSYWRAHDLVMAYLPASEFQDWSVQVCRVKLINGQWVHTGDIRGHCTSPDKRDSIVAIGVSFR
jgi:hypothetical protein